MSSVAQQHRSIGTFHDLCDTSGGFNSQAPVPQAKSGHLHHKQGHCTLYKVLTRKMSAVTPRAALRLKVNGRAEPELASSERCVLSRALRLDLSERAAPGLTSSERCALSRALRLKLSGRAAPELALSADLGSGRLGQYSC